MVTGLDALELVSAPEADQDRWPRSSCVPQAAYGAGELESAVAAWETAHGLRLAAGRSRAAWAAGMVALYLLIDTGMMAPVRGWLRRADRLLGDRADAPARRSWRWSATYERFMCGDLGMRGRTRSGR